MTEEQLVVLLNERNNWMRAMSKSSNDQPTAQETEPRRISADDMIANMGLQVNTTKSKRVN